MTTTGRTWAGSGRSAAMAIGALTLLTAVAGGAPAYGQAATAATAPAPAGDEAVPVLDKQRQKLEKQLKKEQAQRQKELDQRRKEQAKRLRIETRQREKAERKNAAAAGKVRQADGTPTAEPAKPVEPVIQPVAGLTPPQRLARVVELLGANDEATARVELKALLAEAPRSREALVLQQSVIGNPYAMVPRGSFSYIVAPGDSFISLARDYLGNSYKFYALARISGIAVNALKLGDTIQIPGRLRDPVRPGAARPRRSYARPRALPRRVPAAPAAAAGTAPAVPQADPVTALRLRRQGLEQMTAGRIDAAVARLGRAQQLDPENKAIAADLARARRIRGAVRTR